MNKKEIIATILQYAQELDDAGFGNYATDLDKVADDMTFEEEWDPNIVDKEDAMNKWDEEADLQALLDSISQEDMPESDIGDLSDEELNYRPNDKDEFIERLTSSDVDIFEDE